MWEAKAMKILLVGLGSIGRRHLYNIRHLLPDAEITVMRHDENRLLPDQDEKLADRVVFRLQDALVMKPDCAFITSPAPFHVATATALARQGLHLFVEKPLSDRTDGVAELIALCRQRHLVLMVGYDLRHFSALQIMRANIQQGRIGRVLSFRAEVGQYLPEWRPTVDYRQTVTARRALGGGVLLELSHELDYARWLLGEVTTVQAHLARVGDLEIDVEDLAEIILTFASGAIGSIHLDMLQASPTRCCRVIGSEGTLSCDLINNKVSLYSRQTGQWNELDAETQLAGNAVYLAEIQNFLDSMAGRTAPLATGEDGLKVLEIALAARKSDAENRTIKLCQ